MCYNNITVVKIFPFRGVTYNKKKIRKLSKVISPPYDIISPIMQDKLYEESDFNVVHLILGKDFPGDNEYNNKYVRASAYLDGWMRHEVLLRDKDPAIYIYEQVFAHKRKTHKRIGIIALLRLEEMGRGRVFPHEYTLSKPKMDRIELMRAASANFDCVFSLFQDEKDKFLKIIKKLMRRKPDIEAKGQDGIINRVWKVSQKSIIAKLQKELKDKAVFIADGHHRYEAALRYKNEMKTRNTRFTEEEPYNHIMMYFTPIEGSHHIIMPTHRMVWALPFADIEHILAQLGAYFDILEIPFKKRSEGKAKAKLMAELAKRTDKHAFGLYFKDAPEKYYVITLKDEDVMKDVIGDDKPLAWKKLDVTILHALVFGNILSLQGEDQWSYTRDENEAIDRVKSREFAMAAILNPTPIEQVVDIASRYERMPQKSTYFYPKLTTGLVMNKIIPGERIE